MKRDENNAGSFFFELPGKMKGLVGTRKKGNRTEFFLRCETNPGCSGLLMCIKCLKRKLPMPDEYTELLGSLRSADGETRLLYVVYGREGAVSEENEDLYWRLRDRLWQVLESIAPAEGWEWSPGA